MDHVEHQAVERRLGGALEPVIGQVFFSPEAHAGYEQLGFAASPGDADGVALPDGPAYFTSRGALLGGVPGEVVASAFAVFNPAAVVPAVSHGWSLTTPSEILAVRDAGALGQLDRILGHAPTGADRVLELLRRATDGLRTEGRPLAAGVTSLAAPDHPLGELFRLGELLREYRGDGHTIAWVHAGHDATEIGLLTELYWGLPPRSYSRTRAWSDDDFDAAHERLRSRGLLDEHGAFTDEGRAAREAIERHTDDLAAPVVQRLGDDADELIDLLVPWGARIRAAKGYLGSGPHDLADRGSHRR